jgi:maleate cis-trans isomerase
LAARCAPWARGGSLWSRPIRWRLTTARSAISPKSTGSKPIASEGFAATDSYAIGKLGPEHAREAFARIDRPDIEAFVLPGGNFPTFASIAEWECRTNKPVVTTNQASFWAMLRMLETGDSIPGHGRLLAEVPAG